MDGHKKGFSLLSSALLVMVPWMQISKAVTGGTHVGLADLAIITAAGLALHGVYLAFNTAASRALKLGGKHGGQEGELYLLLPPDSSFCCTPGSLSLGHICAFSNAHPLIQCYSLRSWHCTALKTKP